MRSPERLCQLFGVAAISLLVACTGTGEQAGTGGGAGTGGTSGTGGTPGTGGTGTGTGGSGSGGIVATGGSDAGSTDSAMSSGEAGVPDGGGDGRAAVMASAGCDKMPAQALASYIRQNVMGQNRVYDLYIPDGYQPSRAYPVIFVDHGCDGSIPFSTGNNSMQKVTQGNAILVALRAASSRPPYGGGCFNTGPGSASLAEVPYFDEVLKEVGSSYCVDQARVFMVGFSSGSWLTNLLGCVRAGVIRAQGNSTGGLPSVPKTCAGPIAAMMVHDMQDPQNSYAGGIIARDRILAINGCSMTDSVEYRYDGNPATQPVCQAFQGCKSGYPVVWCPTMNRGHVDQVPITTIGLWRFWSQF